MMTYKVRKQSALVTAVREKLYIYLQTERAPESLTLGEISTPVSLEARKIKRAPESSFGPREKALEVIRNSVLVT